MSPSEPRAAMSSSLARRLHCTCAARGSALAFSGGAPMSASWSALGPEISESTLSGGRKSEDEAGRNQTSRHDILVSRRCWLRKGMPLVFERPQIILFEATTSSWSLQPATSAQGRITLQPGPCPVVSPASLDLGLTALRGKGKINPKASTHEPPNRKHKH